MATLRDRMLDRDAASFVGRAAELQAFDQILAGESPVRVIHAVGPGGIGKSALLREFVRRASHSGFDTIWIDGRDVAPFPQQIEQFIAEVDESRPAVMVFDSYELIASLDSHLRESVLPDLPDATIVVFGSRAAPMAGWFEGGWDRMVQTMQLAALSGDEAKQLAASHGATDVDLDAVVRRSRGVPLAIVVSAVSGGASLGNLTERLLRDEVDSSHLRTLSIASIARVTTPELLADVSGDGDPQESFKWLAARSFSEPLSQGVALHSLVAEAVRIQLRERDPAGEAVLRRSIADHLYRRALAGHRAVSTDLQHLVTDPDVKWGFAADIGNRYRIDAIRAGDAEVIQSVLEMVGEGDWWSITRPFIVDHPEFCGVARDATGNVGGYFVAVTPTGAPAAAEHDPLLGPWLQYARHTLRTTSAVLWRDAIDFTLGKDDVTALLGAGGILATGVANPRYGFLPISPKAPGARQFSEALSATHVPDLDLHAYGQNLECHIVDFGPRGMLAFQRDWIYRETGASPPQDRPDIDPVEVLKLLRDPDAIAHGPAWLGSSPAGRLHRLRDLVTSALATFGEHRDDRLAEEIIVAAYLADNKPHEAIARDLHLSRSAYFRRLHTASQRVSEQLAANLRGDG